MGRALTGGEIRPGAVSRPRTIVGESWDLPCSQRHVFEDDLPEDFGIAEAPHRVEDLDPGQPPFGVVVRGNPLSQVLRGDGRFLEAYVERVYLAVVRDLTLPPFQK